MPHADDFIVQDVLYSRQVHVVFGPIPEDCRLLAMSIYEAWSNGRPVFGQASYPAPAAYVSCELDDDMLARSLKFMGMDPRKYPHLSLIDRTKPEDHNVASAITHAKCIEPKLQVIFLDGLLSLGGGRANDYKETARSMRETISLCRRERVTIIGCVCTSKAKDGAGYVSTRDRMHGSTALQAASQAKILIEPNKLSDDMDCGRTVTVFAPLGNTLKFQYSRSAGPLAYVGDGASKIEMDEWLARQIPGVEITAREILQAAAQYGIPTATLYRWLKDQIELGTIVKSKYGIYLVPVCEVS